MWSMRGKKKQTAKVARGRHFLHTHLCPWDPRILVKILEFLAFDTFQVLALKCRKLS